VAIAECFSAGLVNPLFTRILNNKHHRRSRRASCWISGKSAMFTTAHPQDRPQIQFVREHSSFRIIMPFEARTPVVVHFVCRFQSLQQNNSRLTAVIGG
jgi:hypothetical protein